jgi:hypothetical protein
LDQELINNTLLQVKYNYCAGNWQNVVEYFGEETADVLDLFDYFDYAAVLGRGDVKECGAYQHLAVIQRSLITALFDLEKNKVALSTYVDLEYWYCRLSDKVQGVGKALWVH